MEMTDKALEEAAREYAREEAELMDTYSAHEESFKAGALHERAKAEGLIAALEKAQEMLSGMTTKLPVYQVISHAIAEYRGEVGADE